MNRIPPSRFLGIAGLLLGFAVGLRAATPTFTPSPTAVGTPTPTPTEGPGSYAYTLVNNQLQAEATPYVVPGDSGYSLYVTYTASTAFQAGSVIAFQFPADFQPSLTPTYEVPAGEQYEVGQMTPFDQGVSVTVNGLNPGDPLILEYQPGGNPGFAEAASTTQASESVLVWANPTAVLTPAAGLVPAPPPILVYTATPSPTVTLTPTISATFTVSPTFTVSQTFTISPTFTVSPTVTDTPTATPIGPAPSPSVGFYTYPNPFNIDSEPWVTVRFDPTNQNVQITIFSLMGYPVRVRRPLDVDAAAGFAHWDGTDDYGHLVAGGLYFVRLKTPTKTLVHKMTVLH